MSLQSALTGLEAALGLVDDVYAALAAHDTAVPVPILQRAERVADLHGRPFPLSQALNGAVGFASRPSPARIQWWAVLGSNQ